MKEGKTSSGEKQIQPLAAKSHPLEIEEIIKEYFQPIRAYLTRLIQNSNEAEDLTQETFIKVNRSLHLFRGDSSLATWLYRIATNVGYDYLKQKSIKRSKEIESLEEHEVQGLALVDNDSISPEKSIERSEMSSCVQDYVNQLDIKYRLPLVLHDEHGLKNAEIAEVLCCSLANVKMRLHRGRKMIHELLSNGCNFSRDERNVLVCQSKDDSTIE